MKNILYPFLFVIMPSCFLAGQTGFSSLGGANFLSMGGVGVCLEGIGSVYMNQSGLTNVKDWAVDISLERRFNLEDLNLLSFAFAKKTKLGTFALSASNFGFTDYNEQKFGLAYARKLMQNVSFGGQFDVLRYNVLGVGSRSLITFEFGGQFLASKKVKIGAHIFSPGKLTVDQQTNIATRFRLGTMYLPSDKVKLMVDFDKAIDRPLEYKLGLSYQIVDAFAVRFGVNPRVELFSFGGEFRMANGLKILMAFGLNDRLGNTPAVSVQYER